MQKKLFLLRATFSIPLLILMFGAIICGANVWVANVARDKIFRDVDLLEKSPAALVLGAHALANGEPSDILRDRLDSAIKLFAAEKVERIIVSGDNSSENYDETDTMKNYLLAKNIPPRVIFTDYAGFDTFDSIYRAREIFGAEKLILVSQEFHLPRALFLAEKLGIEAVGFSADVQKYRDQTRLNLREILANVKAVGNILFGSQPHFLGEKFKLMDDGTLSWDD